LPRRGDGQHSVVSIGLLTLDVRRRRLHRGGEEQPLTALQVALLVEIAGHR
jgi:DNA-binding response OmpR family regulator